MRTYEPETGVADRNVDWRFPLALYTPVVALLGLTVVASRITGHSPGALTRDTAYTLHGHPFIGAVSNVGILLWCVGATVCLATWAVRRRVTGGADAISRSFLVAGAFTTLLMLDDLFLIHEFVVVDYLGLEENMLLGVYVLATLAYLLRFRSVLFRSRELALLFIVPCTFFSLSLAVDFIHGSGWEWKVLVEDGFKLLGIVGWTGYFSLSAWRLLEERHPLTRRSA